MGAWASVQRSINRRRSGGQQRGPDGVALHPKNRIWIRFLGLGGGFSLNGSERKDTYTPTLLEPHQNRVLGIRSVKIALEIETGWATRNSSLGNCWSERRSPSLSVVNSSQARSVPPTPWPGRTHPLAGGKGRDQLGTSLYPPDLTSTRQGKRSDLPNLMPGVGKAWKEGCRDHLWRGLLDVVPT